MAEGKVEVVVGDGGAARGHPNGVPCAGVGDGQGIPRPFGQDDGGDGLRVVVTGGQMQQWPALEMIAGERQCINNLLSDKAIAREALAIIRAVAFWALA